MSKILEESKQILLFILEQKLLVFLENAVFPNSFVFGSEKYSALFTEYDDWTGHYDWLRSSDGIIAGVRYWPFSDVFEKIKDSLISKPFYVRVNQASIDIYLLSTDMQSTEEQGEQAFGYNRIFISDVGTVAITFGINWLTDMEFKFILPYISKR
jgi:hypothetical protein